MTTDPIADYLTRIRNATRAGHEQVSVSSSKIKNEISRVLLEKGYISGYSVDKNVSVQGALHITLKYNNRTKKSAILTLKRVSRPGLRKYTNYDNLPEVINGLGIAIISTPKGVMSDKEARKERVGGEVLCYVY